MPKSPSPSEEYTDKGKWGARDILAIVFFIILAYLLTQGQNGVILALLGLVVGFYFGDKRSSVVMG